MPDVSDMELLRDYGRHGSEAAFAELVRRHVNLVYSAALRHVGIAAHAEEITQAVFVILARKAARLHPDTILDAWFYQTARLTSLSFLRGERRRQWREQEAFMQSTLEESGESPIWNQLAPLLDEAMARLGTADREAVVLRFFKGKSLNEVAAALKITEPAAQSRVHRAVEKLQRYFLQRGIDSTTAAIAGAISANSIQTAPLALAKTVTAVALAKGAAASTSTLTLIKGALKIMAWTKVKTAVVAGAVVLLAVGAATDVIIRMTEARNYTIAQEPFLDLGAATPKAAVQTLAWALVNDKSNRVAALMQWDETGSHDSRSSALARQYALTEVLSPAAKRVESYRILSVDLQSQPDEAKVKIEKTFKHIPNVSYFAPYPVTLKLHRVGSQWQVIGSVNYEENKASRITLPFVGDF